MTSFKHKTLPIEIPYSEYVKLSSLDQSDFIIVNTTPQRSAVTHVTNNNVRSTSKTDDLLGLGKVAETAGTIAVLPFAFVKSIFD